MNNEPLFSLISLRFGYPKRAVFLGPMDFEIPATRMLGVIGPNGAGKSTLLRLIVGLLTPRTGQVLLSGCPVQKMNARRRASIVAFLPQNPQAPQDLTAREVVLLGRFPRRTLRFFDSHEDHRITEAAMGTTQTMHFADRTLDTLSAGERQRVHLAAALAQEPAVLVLDEPTSALDPYHQISMFGLLKRLCHEENMTVVVVTHDLNLAGQHCDTILLLAEGCVAAIGAVDEVLRTETLERVYGIGFRTVASGTESRPWVLPLGPATVGTP